MATKPLRVVLCWHMHQPDYRDPSNGESLTSWTYLYAFRIIPTWLLTWRKREGNRAWDLLCQAKGAVDKALPLIDDQQRKAAIRRQLSVCEGSGGLGITIPPIPSRNSTPSIVTNLWRFTKYWNRRRQTTWPLKSAMGRGTE